MSHLGHLEREQLYLGDLLTIVINHLLNGMILQAYNRPGWFFARSTRLGMVIPKQSQRGRFKWNNGEKILVVFRVSM